jgi:hypothetical protein
MKIAQNSNDSMKNAAQNVKAGNKPASASGPAFLRPRLAHSCKFGL